MAIVASLFALFNLWAVGRSIDNRKWGDVVIASVAFLASVAWAYGL